MEAKGKRKFKWIAIFPYDLPQLRPDWVNWINHFDFSYVYSRFGHNLLKQALKDIRYFRPPLRNSDVFKKYGPEKRNFVRKAFFPSIPEHFTVFGFVGRNQLRKDPQRLIRAFAEIKRKEPDSALYLHTEVNQGVYNLQQIMLDYGLKTGDVIVKPHNLVFSPEKMVDVYNAMDCLVNCTLHEGLSWTVIEAMACGTPVIASHSTAHTELLEGGAGVLVPCKELTYMPVVTGRGQSWVETFNCKVEDIFNAMMGFKLGAIDRNAMRENGL
jgi:glycosyltransferase involved in cell wall biosynthesis